MTCTLPWKCSTACTQHSMCMHVHFCCSKWAHKVSTQINRLWHPSGLHHHARTKSSTGNRLSLIPNRDSSNFLFALPPFLVSPWSRTAHYHFACCFCFLNVKKKSKMWHRTGFCGQTQARIWDMTIWHPVHFSSRKHRTCCCCVWDSGYLNIYPLSVRTYSWITRLSFFFVFPLILHQNLAFEWLSGHEQNTTAAYGALSCPKTWGPLLYSGEQRRKGIDKLPATVIPQKTRPSSLTPSPAGGGCWTSVILPTVH